MKDNMEEEIQKFYKELPENIIPIQKAFPPFMRYEKGYGFQGVLLLDTNIDKVQCHICGVWKKSLSSHLRLVHKMKAEDYKDSVGLFRKTPLMSLKTLRKYKRTWKMSKEKLDNLVQGRKEYSFRKNHDVSGKNGLSKMQYKNKFSSCDAQLKHRVEIAKEKWGCLPTERQEPKLAEVIRYRFGSYYKGLKQLKINP